MTVTETGQQWAGVGVSTADLGEEGCLPITASNKLKITASLNGSLEITGFCPPPLTPATPVLQYRNGLSHTLPKPSLPNTKLFRGFLYAFMGVGIGLRMILVLSRADLCFQIIYNECVIILISLNTRNTLFWNRKSYRSTNSKKRKVHLQSESLTWSHIQPQKWPLL